MSEIEITGKNLEEALELAARELKTTKDNIEHEVLEESNKRLFSILAPKYIKIKAKMIDANKIVEEKGYVKNDTTTVELTEQEKKIVSEKIDKFLTEYLEKMKLEYTYEISFKEEFVDVVINGDSSGILIGYRGEVLDSLQLLINTIANKGLEKHIKIHVDIENYRAKRKDTLESLAKRIAQNVVNTGKDVTLEPMAAYERRIIHSAIQSNTKVETRSIGEEPYRRVVITLKK